MSTSLHLGRFLAALGVVALLACDSVSPTAPGVIGHIKPDALTDSSHPMRPQIPETATAGVPLELTFWTWGFCLAGESTEVSVDGRTALVTGYRFAADVRGVCTLVLHPMEHKANVVFTEPGTARIVLRYRTISYGFFPLSGG